QGALTTALQLQPADSYARYYLGRVELQEGRFREALRDLEKSKLPWPGDADFLLRVAAGYVHLGQREEALKTATRLDGMRLSPAQTVSLGSVLAKLHENQKLLDLFERLERQNAGAFWAEFDLALAEVISGHSHEAAARAASMAAQCKCWAASSLAGIAEARLGKHERAIAAFWESAKLDPRQEERWLDLTRELMGVQRYGQAIEAAKEGLRNNPQSYLLHLRLGAAYLSGGRYQQAEQVFRNLIAHNDPLPTSTVGLAQVLLRTGRMKEAAAVVAEAQKRIGNDFLLAYFRGIALERSGKPEEAILSFEDALRFKPQNGEAHRWLGEVEVEAGHASAAVRQLREALKLNPSDSQAQLLLGRAYRMARNPQAAAALAREVKPGALPKPGNDESQDFLMPSWQMPPSENPETHDTAISSAGPPGRH
ncbi:MAG TPA: tetratricopeptide repeat protein, partial [Terriglobia bacterium]|nr:tetratricopeptide repeat protein [Terriglobia bacterium]